MSIQIALRLPDDVVKYIDAEVAAGRAKSRSDVVARFVERDRRRIRAAEDVERLLADRTSDFDDLALAAVATKLDID